jgi:hypothetical protein
VCNTFICGMYYICGVIIYFDYDKYWYYYEMDYKIYILDYFDSIIKKN